MKNYLNDDIEKTVSTQPKKKAEENSFGSSKDLGNTILRRKSGSNNNGMQHMR